ncbi:MAG: glycosyltransferase, partial [Planctomycetota bacterium]|nr:glycosyltransferase [Planctomycetota bacterium]
LATDRPTLLVTGASNGASTLNALVLNLARTQPEAFAGWQILHLAGSAHHSHVQETWNEMPLANCPVTVFPFLRQMSQAFGAADLVVSRAGANSVAEIEAAGLPALYLPYPWHKDQHQRFNAEAAAEAKAAIIANDQIEDQPNLEQIGPILSDLLTNQQQLTNMTIAARARQCRNDTSELTRKILDAFGIVPTRGGSA